MTDPASLRRASASALASIGVRVDPALPMIDAGKLALRDGSEVARRALVLNVLTGVAFDWPREAGLRWVERHGLETALQPDELALLRRPGNVTDADRWLRLHVETLGMALWLGGLCAAPLLPWDPLPANTASSFPNPFNDQSPAPFLAAFRLRDADAIHYMLDLYFRAHAHARQCEREGKPEARIPYAAVQFRRLLLEWTCHAGVGWHDTDLGT